MSLAFVPGFHEARRAVFDGTLEQGAVVFAIYCACNDAVPAARIAAHPASPSPFRYARIAENRVQFSPALDLRTEAGHFATEPLWELFAESMPATLVKGRAISVAKGTAPARETRVAAATPSATQSCPHGKCPHELGLHDPCSLCGCPNITISKKVQRAARRKR